MLFYFFSTCLLTVLSAGHIVIVHIAFAYNNVVAQRNEEAFTSALRDALLTKYKLRSAQLPQSAVKVTLKLNSVALFSPELGSGVYLYL